VRQRAGEDRHRHFGVSHAIDDARPARQLHRRDRQHREGHEEHRSEGKDDLDAEAKRALLRHGAGRS
jgi:hypothetical protein